MGLNEIIHTKCLACGRHWINGSYRYHYSCCFILFHMLSQLPSLEQGDASQGLARCQQETSVPITSSPPHPWGADPRWGSPSSAPTHSQQRVFHEDGQQTISSLPIKDRTEKSYLTLEFYRFVGDRKHVSSQCSPSCPGRVSCGLGWALG